VGLKINMEAHDMLQICGPSKIEDVNVVENIIAIKLHIGGQNTSRRHSGNENDLPLQTQTTCYLQ